MKQIRLAIAEWLMHLVYNMMPQGKEQDYYHKLLLLYAAFIIEGGKENL